MSRHPIERFMMPMRMMSRPWDSVDIASSTACDFLEVYNNPQTCRKEIRRAGVAANLGGAAIDALNEVYNQVAIVGNDRRPVTRQAHENFTRSLATAVNRNLNQLAEDKLWPMFWMMFHHDGNRAPRYERERSGEFVATFKADFGLSNADWKMFCNAGHVYLYNHFDIDFRRVRDGLHPIYVRWPRHIRLECRDTINRIQQQAPQLFPWLRELFKDDANHRIDPREFNYTVSDYCDTLGHVPQEDTVKILKAKSWNAFRQIISRLHNGNYGRSPGNSALRAMSSSHLFHPGLEIREYQRAIMHEMATRLMIDPALMRNGPIERKETKPEKLDVYTGVQSLGHVPQEDTVKILKAKSWNAFRQIISRLHNGNYGRSPAWEGSSGLTIESLRQAQAALMRNNVPHPDFMDEYIRQLGMQMAIDPAMMRAGITDPSTAKPTHVVKYTSIPTDVPTTFNAHGCECVLIDTNEKLYEEGTGMGHCIWRMYQTRIKDGKYIAYHVKYAGDDPGHKGWTLGYRLQEDNEWQRVHDEMILGEKKPKKEPEWKLDQIRGYKNEIPKHKALDAVAEMLLAVIRGDVKMATYQKETK